MSQLPDNYLITVARLKEYIQNARLRSALKANAVLLGMYWEIGKAILEMQQAEGWGAKVLDRLSSDLRADFPDVKGFSVRNLKYMLQFAKVFPEFGKQAAVRLHDSDYQQVEIGQQAAAQLPWGHLQLIMDKVSEKEAQLFYTHKCVENGWSRNILGEQIESGLYERQGKAITNFSQTLPAVQSDLAHQSLKNPYLFDFLSLGEAVKERDLENALIQHIKHFMLELGRGFAYVGRQHKLTVQDDDFFLDLLFYNYNLHCFVIFELKVGDFKPEYAGKLNFYVNAINENFKGPKDQPTIGVLLCKTPNETVVRFSLKGIESPIGVADYQLAEALPKQLKGEMPSVEELEAEIEKEAEELKKPSQKKLERIKKLLGGLNQPKVEEKRNEANILKIFTKVLLPLGENLKQALLEISEEFEELLLVYWTSHQGFDTPQEVYAWLEQNKITQEFKISIELKGCKPAGTKAFDIRREILVQMNTYNYTVSLGRDQRQNGIIENLYHHLPDQEELRTLVEKMEETIYEDIEQNLRLINPDINE